MRIMIQKLAVWIPAVFWVQQQYDFWPSFAEWWPWSPKETGRSSAVGITQVSSSYRPRQHWLFQIGWFQHCSREKEAQLRNLRHVIRNHKVRKAKVPTNLLPQKICSAQKVRNFHSVNFQSIRKLRVLGRPFSISFQCRRMKFFIGHITHCLMVNEL